MIIALKVIVNNMLCFGNILHLYFCLHLNIYIYVYSDILFMLCGRVFFYF